MTNSRKRELSVYDGQACMGAIKVADDGTAVAFGASGKRLGAFRSLKDASAAFDQKPLKRRRGGATARARAP
jgi:hypothetical protein